MLRPKPNVQDEPYNTRGLSAEARRPIRERYYQDNADWHGIRTLGKLPDDLEQVKDQVLSEAFDLNKLSKEDREAQFALDRYRILRQQRQDAQNIFIARENAKRAADGLEPFKSFSTNKEVSIAAVAAMQAGELPRTVQVPGYSNGTTMEAILGGNVPATFTNDNGKEEPLLQYYDAGGDHSLLLNSHAMGQEARKSFQERGVGISILSLPASRNNQRFSAEQIIENVAELEAAMSPHE